MDETTEAASSFIIHWPLVWAIGAVVVVVIVVLRFIFVAIRSGREMIQKEIHEGVVISLSNGAGKIVHTMAKAGTAEALREHQIVCPIRDKTEGLKDRVQAQHERILLLEKKFINDEDEKG